MNDDLSYPGIDVGDWLGRGCSAETYAAKGKEGEKLIAKRFNSMSIDRNFLLGNFRRMEDMPEHRGIPELVSYQMDTAPYVAVTSYAEGKPIGELGSVKEGEAWKIIRELVEVLGHAHKHGVIHGNLHPGNVFYFERTGKKAKKNKEGDENSKSKKSGPEVTVTDFGSGMIGDIHHIDLDENTFFFSPDQLQSQGSDWEDGAALRWDVYSFGILAYCLVNGSLPRGQSYLKDHRKEVTSAGGRPVAVNADRYVEEVENSPEVAWSRKLVVTREHRLFREIIDACLSLDPKRRPVDLREVRNRFEALDKQFALEDAEDRVIREKLKQKAKLFGARATAIALGLFFILASFYLIEFLKKSHFFKNKASELDQVVNSQKAHIDVLDQRWTDTMTDLKNSREAADAFFSKMAHGNDAGGSGVATLKTGELKKSRDYYLKTLEDVGQKEEAKIERARAQHSLAHIEYKLENSKKAAEFFQLAIDDLHSSLQDEDDEETKRDFHLRLADCHESLSDLHANAMGEETLNSLRLAVKHFDSVLESTPDDASIILRQAGTCLKLGKVLDAHRLYDEAILSYSKAADLTVALQENSPDSETLGRLIGQLQFRAAKTLKYAGRIDESIDAHIASMEGVEKERTPQGYTPLQTLQLSESYIELGEMFSKKEGATPEDRDQLYNEALRLLTPLNTENPKDVDVAILLCKSLSNLGKIEKDASNWSSGYKLSVRGIESLVHALGENPRHIIGILELAEARVEHIDFLENEKKTAREVALRGIQNAEQAQQSLEKSEEVVEPFRTQIHERLGVIFRTYGDLCKSMGETEASNRCYAHASKSLSFLNREPKENSGEL